MSGEGGEIPQPETGITQQELTKFNQQIHDVMGDGPYDRGTRMFKIKTAEGPRVVQLTWLKDLNSAAMAVIDTSEPVFHPDEGDVYPYAEIASNPHPDDRDGLGALFFDYREGTMKKNATGYFTDPARTRVTAEQRTEGRIMRDITHGDDHDKRKLAEYADILRQLNKPGAKIWRGWGGTNRIRPPVTTKK